MQLRSLLLAVLSLVLIAVSKAQGGVEGAGGQVESGAEGDSASAAALLDEIAAEVQLEGEASKAAVSSELSEGGGKAAAEAAPDAGAKKEKVEAVEPPAAPKANAVESTATTSSFLQPFVNTFAALGRLWHNIIRALLKIFVR